MADDFSNQPRVFDGARWYHIDIDKNNNNNSGGGGSSNKLSPMPPVLFPLSAGGEANGASQSAVDADADADNTIFVSVVSYRDSKRCGATIKSVFDNAKDASKVVVGLVDQVNTEAIESTCIQEFCKLQGATHRAHTCAYTNQIREVGAFSKGSAGPGVARALQRKNLGNEEFCMQVDSHTVFVQDWDTMAKEEWMAANNECAVISTLPPKLSEQSLYTTKGGSKEHQVPRICQTSFSAINLPMFTKQPVGIAERLEEPLLGHAWCAGFSFSKCHLEEAVPYDFFLPQIFDGEEFPRFARMWTRVSGCTLLLCHCTVTLLLSQTSPAHEVGVGQCYVFCTTITMLVYGFLLFAILFAFFFMFDCCIHFYSQF
jgi:hypothetical protein